MVLSKKYLWALCACATLGLSSVQAMEGDEIKKPLTRTERRQQKHSQRKQIRQQPLKSAKEEAKTPPRRERRRPLQEKKKEEEQQRLKSAREKEEMQGTWELEKRSMLELLKEIDQSCNNMEPVKEFVKKEQKIVEPIKGKQELEIVKENDRPLERSTLHFSPDQTIKERDDTNYFRIPAQKQISQYNERENTGLIKEKNQEEYNVWNFSNFSLLFIDHSPRDFTTKTYAIPSSTAIMGEELDLPLPNDMKKKLKIAIGYTKPMKYTDEDQTHVYILPRNAVPLSPEQMPTYVPIAVFAKKEREPGKIIAFDPSVYGGERRLSYILRGNKSVSGLEFFPPECPLETLRISYSCWTFSNACLLYTNKITNPNFPGKSEILFSTATGGEELKLPLPTHMKNKLKIAIGYTKPMAYTNENEIHIHLVSPDQFKRKGYFKDNEFEEMASNVAIGVHWSEGKPRKSWRVIPFDPYKYAGERSLDAILKDDSEFPQSMRYLFEDFKISFLEK